MKKIKTVNQAINAYYLTQVLKGEIKATGELKLCVTKTFPNFNNCAFMLEHWAEALRKILNKTVMVEGVYKCGKLIKSYEVVRKTKADALKEWRALR